MTPKEKANELMKKYVFYTVSDFSDENFEQTRNCALIAVDEILSNSFLEPQLKRHIGSVEPLPIHLEYWFEVKKEIENL